MQAPSEPPSISAAAASDVSSGERLYVGMTEEGPFRRRPDDDAARSPRTMGYRQEEKQR